MVDIHHHLLPGVDDGPADMETSIAMVEMAVEDGVTHIVATPHANNTYEYDRAAHEALLQTLREALPSAIRDRITLGLGSDFHLLFENVAEAKADPAKFSINGKGYLMVELPDHGIPRNIEEVLYDLRVAGLVPVLTHPERNATLQANPETLKSWLEGGLLLQVTANSVTGEFGKVAHRISNLLLDNNWVHFVASDAHSIGRRNPRLSPAYARVAKRRGEETAHRLFVANPLAAFEGRDLPEQPEPLGLHDDLEPKSWWKRLFGSDS
jgi:protein-tyrosine phosphatase